MNATQQKAPWHLWVVGIVTTLWNAGGAFDYTATQLRLEGYMAQFTEAQLEYFYGFPAWMDGVWALAVWCALLGSISLLLRKAWAVALFGIALLSLAASTVYNFVLSDGLAVMGSQGAIFTAVIWVVMIFLFIYSRALEKRRVLT